MASFPSSAKSACKGSDVAVSYENHTAIDTQEREGGRAINLNGLYGNVSHNARPLKRVQAWDTALYNTDSTTEDKPPAYEELSMTMLAWKMSIMKWSMLKHLPLS